MAVFVILTVVDEDFLDVEHVVAAMTVLGVIIAICRSVIPDEVITLSDSAVTISHYFAVFSSEYRSGLLLQ